MQPHTCPVPSYLAAVRQESVELAILRTIFAIPLVLRLIEFIWFMYGISQEGAEGL
jgi:hypothetical protein